MLCCADCRGNRTLVAETCLTSVTFQNFRSPQVKNDICSVLVMLTAISKILGYMFLHAVNALNTWHPCIHSVSTLYGKRQDMYCEALKLED